MSVTVSFNEQTYRKEYPVVIYGASVWGELAYIALKHIGGITVDCFCDRVQNRKKYLGLNVIGPDKLEEFKNASIIIASADFFYEIKKMLEDRGFHHLFDMRELLISDIPKEQLSNRALEMYDNRQYYIYIVDKQTEQGVVFNRIQYVVTEKCSLKCKDCSHLMQYYKNPHNVELERYRECFDRLLECVDYIAELRILGGEPFMNREMGKVIEWYCNEGKIQYITVYTNGTIIPGEDILNALKKDKVKVHISNYKINEASIKKLTSIFDQYRIQYFVRAYDSWQDAGGVQFRDYSEKQMKSIFAECFERNGFTFLRDRLYRCPRAAHTMNLKAMPDMKGDYVDLSHHDSDRNDLVRQLRELQQKLYLEGCNYCGGPNNHVQNIPAARQITEPIWYEMGNY